MPGEVVLDVTGGAFVQQATDPVVVNVSTPIDFAAQFPQPLDTTEIVAMCEEITVWRTLPEKMTMLKAESWRELNELALTSGSLYVSFADGACPEEYAHDGDNTTVTLKNIGVKKSLTVSDIMHSMGSIAAGYGMQRLIGPGQASSGLPGGGDQGTFAQAAITDLKSKEITLGTTLVLNEWDNLLVNGNVDTSSLQFDGLVEYGEGFAYNDNSASGTFSASTYDKFLAELCVKPTHIFGHPTAIQEMMAAYFVHQYQGSQTVNLVSGDRIVPGINFASFVNTGVGRMQVVADVNFPRTDAGTGKFLGSLYALRMSHNGEPLVYKITQIPLSVKDLAPGCTAVSFEIWAKTALVIKHLCAHSRFDSVWGKSTVTQGCTQIG